MIGEKGRGKIIKLYYTFNYKRNIKETTSEMSPEANTHVNISSKPKKGVFTEALGRKKVGV